MERAISNIKLKVKIRNPKMKQKLSENLGMLKTANIKKWNLARKKINQVKKNILAIF